MNVLDPEHKYFTSIVSNQHCINIEGASIKDINIFGNIHLRNVLIIDNLIQSFCLNLKHGIPILEWRGDPNDKELLHIQPYLQDLLNCEDMAHQNAKRFKYHYLEKL